MTYEEALEFLYNSLPVFHREGAGAYKPGLDTSRRLDALWGFPSHRFPSIHIAGTNGKGSTAHTVAAILQCQGYKTGLYTSPHIFDFGERIRVDGAKIPREAVVAFVEKWARLSKQHPSLTPSFFELTSTMAFAWFAQCGVDFAVIETGLGGRLDSTNIISPILSVITNISLDHTQFLGDTRAKIAAEKAGIIKEGVPVVIGETDSEIQPVFEQVAAKKEAPLFVAAPVEAEVGEDFNVYPSTPFGPLRGQLTGTYQKLNTATVLAAVERLRAEGVEISDEAVARGLSSVVSLTGLQGRWTRVGTNPTTVIDTGHNEGGWKRIGEQIAVSGVKEVALVCGFVADKDLTHIFDTVRSIPAIRNIYFSTPSTPRGLQASELARKASEAGIKGRVVPDVNEAVALARASVASDGLVLVAGSNFLIADLNLSGVCPE